MPVRSLNWIYIMASFDDDGHWAVASRPKKEKIIASGVSECERESHAVHVIRTLLSEEIGFSPK